MSTHINSHQADKYSGHVNTQTSTILLIGSGKLAQHLRHWHSLLPHKINSLLTWDRHQDPLALPRYLQQATHVWLAISDSALVPFYEKYLQGFDSLKVVHFSGAIYDARMIAAHPMMTFSERLYDESVYKKIFFALTGVQKLNEALPDFYNASFVLSPEDKPLYHAMCVISGNFPQILWAECLKICTALNIQPEAFSNYIRQATTNFVIDQEKSLTGPIARGDQNTICANKKSLITNAYDINPQLVTVYEALERLYHGK